MIAVGFNGGGGHFHNTVEAFLAADVVLTPNIYGDGPSVALGPGTWLVIAVITAKSPVNAAQRVTAKLVAGVTEIVGAGADSRAGGAGIVTDQSLTLSAIVLLGATTTVKVQVASSVASSIAAIPTLNTGGLNGKTTSIRAVSL